MEISGFSGQTGRQDFLNLLVTQFRHQDPLSPVKRSQTITLRRPHRDIIGRSHFDLKTTAKWRQNNF